MGRADMANQLKYTEVGRIWNHIIICAEQTKEKKAADGAGDRGISRPREVFTAFDKRLRLELRVHKIKLLSLWF